MIPTRETIDSFAIDHAFHDKMVTWLRSMHSEIDMLRADLDRANTEAALARDAMAKATTDTRAKVQNELRSVERALCLDDVLIKYAAWSRGAYECHVKNTIETAIDALRDDSATTPYSPPFEGDPKDCAFKASDPVREEEIKAWRDWALGDIADPDLYDDCFVLSRAEIDSAVALMRSAGDGKELLRELRAWVADKAGMHLREGFGWFLNSAVERIDEMLARPAPVEKPAAAVTDHVPDAGKMVPVLYWLEDGKFARAMLVGKDLLVVDLTFGDGPSVVGKPEWFDAGYVAAYGGLVPESATRGKEPGQWDYGVASIAKPAAAVPDDIGLGPVTDEMVQSGIAAVKDGRWITLEQLRKELAPVPDDTRELVAQLADAVVTLCDGQGFGVTLSEVQAIAARLRGGA